jgi:hypothetical protein
MYRAFQKYVWADILRGYAEVYINLKITEPLTAVWTSKIFYLSVILIRVYMCIYIYIYMCVCVCIYMRARAHVCWSSVTHRIQQYFV